jgi:hypothetical protein
MDQIHLSPLLDQIQLALGHISNTTLAARPVKAGADWGFRLDVRGTGLQRQGKAETRAPKPPIAIGFFLSSPVSAP